MAYTKKTNWIEARYKCILAICLNGYQSDAIPVVEDSIKTLGKRWGILACRAIVHNWGNCSDIMNDSDMIMAGKIACNNGAGSEFEAFKNSYVPQ
ncbi:MAG: hypothetical protein JEZ07_00590 [Phycisphaerae bacterium]|nr:hypothetical protein [Phycisphaerae bacterium]